MTFPEFKKKYQKKDVEEVSYSPPQNPLVSVMVQTYNHENFIKQCLDSILIQETSFDFEILLGEDDSSDGTREICREYATKYPGKIRLFLHRSENKICILNIPTGNFNALYNFFSAKGDFIAFCEGDDYWNDPLKLQKQINRLTSDSSLSMAYHSYREINERQEPLPQEILLKQPTCNFSGTDLMKITYHPLLSTTCFRNFMSNKIPHEMTSVINIDTFLLSFLGNYGGAAFIDNIIPSFYRRHLGGTWTGQQNELKLKSKLLTYKNLKEYYNRKKDSKTGDFFLNTYNKTLNQLIYYYLRNGKIISIVKFLYSKL